MVPPGNVLSYQSEHHSHTLPCMSNRPHGLGFFKPTAWVYCSPAVLPANHAYSPNCFSSSPKGNVIFVPARHAYSHWASVGRRYVSPAFSFPALNSKTVSVVQNAVASFHSTRWNLVATGRRRGERKMGSSQGFLSCGCKFSHVGASFQLALAFDTMKSCRHKRYRHLILNEFRTGGGDLVGPRRGIQRQDETDRQENLWLENAARPRNRDVSPDEAHPTRAGNISQILLRRLFQRAVSANWEKGTKTAKAEARARAQRARSSSR